MEILFIALGIVVGYLAAFFKRRKLFIGTLRVARDEDQSYLFLELLPGANIANKSHVMLKVDLKNDISQE